MATSAAVIAIVRAARPQFNSDVEKLVFAVHAVFLASGYRLAGVGADAELKELPETAPEVPPDGWNREPEHFAFLYVPDAPPHHTVLLKCLPMGDTLLVTAASTKQAGSPLSWELSVSHHVAANAADIGHSYAALRALLTAVQALIDSVAPAGVLPSTTPTGAAAAPASSTGRPLERPQPPSYDPLRAEPRPAGVWGPSGGPLTVGGRDLRPQGVPFPGGGGIPGPGMPAFGGGGMQVGPDHPFFHDRLRHPELQPPGHGVPGLPYGARWDPIRPQGLEGWLPTDFQRPPPGQRQPDPDIGIPPPKGTDFDHMFG